MKRLSLLASAVIAFMCLGALPLQAQAPDIIRTAREGRTKVVKELIAAGADVNTLNDSDATA